MILLTECVVLAIAGVLIWHASRVEGWGFVMVFWGGGMAVGLLREWTVVHFTPLYSYGDFFLQLGGIPLIMAVFWSNFAYVALRWSENILGSAFITRERTDEHHPLVFLVMAVISMAVEAYASQFHMINWEAEPVLTLWGGTPAIVPFGYGAMGLLFLIAFRAVWRRWQDRLEVALSWLILLSPVIILVQLGFLLVVKALLGLLFGSPPELA